MLTIRRKLALLIGAALTVMALGASSASASTEFRFDQTGTEYTCNETEFGYCPVAATNGEYSLMSGGYLVAACQNASFDMVLYENGEFIAENAYWGDSQDCNGATPLHGCKSGNSSVPLPGRIYLVEAPLFGYKAYKAEMEVCAGLDSWRTLTFDVELDENGAITGLVNGGTYGMAGVNFDLDGEATLVEWEG